jgi:hypothetical protein
MNEPTFEVLMQELQLACGRLMLALMRDAMKPAILFLRFMLWVNG